GAVRVEGEKMSKSLGNFFTIRDVLEKYHPEVVRLLLIGSHYRSPINYSEDNLIEAKAGLDRFYSALRNFSDVVPMPLLELRETQAYHQFAAAMEDDFNTRVALAGMYDLVRDLNTAAKSDNEAAKDLAAQLKALGGVLGILQENPQRFLQADNLSDNISAEQIEQLIAERIEAKQSKNYARADEIRQNLLTQGVEL